MKGSLQVFSGARKGHFAGFETSERVTSGVLGILKCTLEEDG
jgi:hypothetical protein